MIGFLCLIMEFGVACIENLTLISFEIALRTIE